jgi:hypothetical protein
MFHFTARVSMAVRYVVSISLIYFGDVNATTYARKGLFYEHVIVKETFTLEQAVKARGGVEV